MSRFDYVKYDEHAQEQQEYAKGVCTMIETFIINEIRDGGARHPGTAGETALRKLEECYMWIGKAIRNEQIKRNGSAPLLEERKDG